MSSISISKKDSYTPSKVKLLSISNVKPSQVLLYTFLGFVALMQIYPLIYLFFFSLKDNGEILGGNVIGLPENWLWSNYKTVFSNSAMPTYFFNSAFITSLTVVLVVVLAGTAGYAIQRMKWKYSKLVLTIFLLGLMIPIQSSLLPLYKNFAAAKIMNTYLSLLIPYVAFSLPLAVYVFTGFYESIPYEMEESGCLEGCNIFQIYSHIILPMVKPAVATIAIFTYRGIWNELLLANIFISKKWLKTIPVGLQSLDGRYSTEWGPIGAALLIAVLPSLLLYFILSKKVQESMMAGAIKG